MSGQANLFGEPPLLPALSQWPTPSWLARLCTNWIEPGQLVLEPSCGGGNLIAALIESGHRPEDITGVELDPAWLKHCHDRFGGEVKLHLGDFLDPIQVQLPRIFDVVLMNCPFEDGMHGEFISRALTLAPAVVGVFPVAVEFSGGRDRGLWKNEAVVVRRARLPERVQYAGTTSPKFDTVVLDIRCRERPRFEGEVMRVDEEVWGPV